MKETEAKWERQRLRANELLKEIGQENPPCGFGVGDGWFPHVAKALREINKVGIPWELAQVKQKFCQLRIYIDFPGSGKVIPVDFLGSKSKRVDVGMPKEDGSVSIWEKGHPDHDKYLRVNELIREAEIACDTSCESCGAQTGGGAASGWKGCEACKKAEKERLKKEGY